MTEQHAPSEIRDYTLPNGFRVALQKTPLKTVAGRLRVWHGGLHEQPGEEGIAHFLEHAVLNGGSAKYLPHEGERIKDLLGEVNANTSPTRTHYTMHLLAEDVGAYLDFIADAVFQPRLASTIVDEERQRILREISDYRGKAAYEDYRLLQQSLFGKQSPHIYDVLGKPEVVASANESELRAFHERGYHANNMDLVLVGDLPNNIDELIAAAFAHQPRGDGAPCVLPPVPPRTQRCELYRGAPELLNRAQPLTSNAHIILGLHAPPANHADGVAVNLLSALMGGVQGSRLFNAVSRRLGLAYHIGAHYDGRDGKGLIQIAASVHASSLESAINAVFEELNAIREDGIREAELDKVKRKNRFEYLTAMNEDKGQVRSVERTIDDGISSDELLNAYTNLTCDDIHAVANKYLPKSRDDEMYVLLVRNPLLSA
jgi:predicted Zn-dependent peptidase